MICMMWQSFFVIIFIDTFIGMLRSLLFFAIIGIVPIAEAQTSDWKLEKQGNGIKVFTRKRTDVPVKECKAITTVGCSMETLVGLLEDIPGFPNWQPNVSSARVLKEIDENERYLYYTTELPWPLDDRDVVVTCKKYNLKNGSIKYTMEALPDYFDEVDGFVRIKKTKAFWLFVPKPDGKIKIVYQFYGDPSGEMPKSVVNMFVVSGPYDTLSNIRKMK